MTDYELRANAVNCSVSHFAGDSPIEADARLEPVALETERLHLRPIMSGDRNDLIDLLTDEALMRYSDEGHALSVEAAAEWISAEAGGFDHRGRGVMTVRDRSTDQVPGYCGLFDHEDIDGQQEVEIGYRFKATKWGNGYATEAVRALLKYTHEDLGLARIVARIDPSNIASKKVAEKTI